MDRIRKWGCHFDGKDALSFLERVEELREGYGISEEELLQGLPELLKGDVLLWYRNNRLEWATWQDFTKNLKQSYVPHRATAQLERKIRDRIQTPSETFFQYSNSIRTLMRRAGTMGLDEQLDRIYENMNPHYRDYIRRDQATSLENSPIISSPTTEPWATQSCNPEWEAQPLQLPF